MDGCQEQTVSLLRGMRSDRRTYERPGDHEQNVSEKHLRIGERTGARRRQENLSGGGYAKRIAIGGRQFHISGGDALRGDTRSHPEHDG